MEKEKPETKVCKHCKTEIPYDAKICPQCRKRVKKRKAPLVILIVIIVIFLILLLSPSESSTSSDLIDEVKSMSEEEFKASTTDMEYNELFRHIDDHKGDLVHYVGEVEQVCEEGDSKSTYRIAVTEEDGWYDDIVFAVFGSDVDCDRILEEDIVEFWGVVVGDYSYTSIFGESITVPKIQVLYANIKE